MKGISTKQIGDGKTPNKYWVSISEDYYCESEPGVMGWASDLGVVKPPKGGTIRVFSSYPAARQFIDGDLPLGEEYNGVVVNTITIEDRISGEVFRRGKEFSPRSGRLWENEHEDLGFTEKTLAERKACSHHTIKRKKTKRATTQAGVRGVR